MDQSHFFQMHIRCSFSRNVEENQVCFSLFLNLLLQEENVEATNCCKNKFYEILVNKRTNACVFIILPNRDFSCPYMRSTRAQELLFIDR